MKIENDGSLFYLERRIYPPNSKQRMEDRAYSFKVEKNYLYLFVSPIAFYGFQIFKDKISSTNSMAIAVEFNKDLFNFSKEFYSGDEFIKSCDFKEVKNLIISILKANIHNGLRHVKVISLSGGYLICKELYTSLENSIREYLEFYWKNKSTKSALGALWCKNFINNLINITTFKKIHTESIFELKTEKPIFLCGAGSSLEDNLEFIKKHRDELFLVAVDTALMLLKEVNIKVDLVIVLEAQFYNFYDFVSCMDYFDKVACDLSSYHVLLREFIKRNKQIYTFTSVFEDLRFFRYMKKSFFLNDFIPALGNVGIVAIYLSSFITKGFIFFSGIDFCFYPGKTHTKSSPHQLQKSISQCKITSFYEYSNNFIPCFDKKKKQVLQTVTMKRDASILLSLIENIKIQERLIDMRNFGLDFHISKNILNYQKFFSKDMNFCNVDVSSQNSPLYKAMLMFIYQELKSTIPLISKIIFKENKNLYETKKLLKALNDLDIFYFYFPDVSLMPNSSDSFLSRLYSVFLYYTQKIESYLNL